MADLKAPKFKKAFGGHKEGAPILSVALSRDGSRAASSADGDPVRWWDVGKGKQGGVGPAKARYVQRVAISPAGDYVLFADDEKDSRLHLVPFESGGEERTFQGEAGSVNALAFADDGSLAVSGSLDGGVRLWDVKTGKPVAI